MRCVKILSYTVPMYGNSRVFPYGKMLVEHEGVQKTVKFGEVTANGKLSITFNRKRYYFHNAGSLYAPTIEFEEEEK